MYHLLETIRIENGSPTNLKWHVQRINRSFRLLYKKKPTFNIAELIEVPDKMKSGRVKLRFLYNEISHKMEYHEYIPKRINTLKLVNCDLIRYDFKYTDRTLLNQLFSLRDECDDILIVKKGQITDTSYCNIVFYDGSNWITPANPLLAGTCRQRLLKEGRINKMKLHPDDIVNFNSYRLINAMMDFDEQDPIDINNIVF